MNKIITLFNKTSDGRLKTWKCWTDNDTLWKEWWIEDGKHQQTPDKIQGKNIGKSNETTAEEQCVLEWERAVRLKREENYQEILTTVNSENINWETGELPPSFGPSKPENSISEEDEQELLNKGIALYSRKSNGMRAFCCVGTKGIKIYSRRLEDKTANFPFHVQDLKFLLPGIILDCEFTLQNKDGQDDPDLIKEVFGTKAEKSIKRQETTHGIPTAIVFDILYINKKQFDATWSEKYETIKSIRLFKTSQHFKPVEILNKQGEKAIAKDGWEGLICADGSAKTKIRFDGKVDRSSGLFKKKFFKECDLVCFEWMKGKGKLNNAVATLKLGAYDKTGNFITICESGSGLTDKIRKEIAQISPFNKFKHFTVEIKYEERTPSGSLRLPIFLRLRTDKKPAECLIEDII